MAARFMFSHLASAFARMILPRGLASEAARETKNRAIRFDLQGLFLWLLMNA